jgi:D-sedoheptulose 7-phosphate isomerase
MTTEEILRGNVERSLDVHRRFFEQCLPALTRAGEAMVAAYRRKGKAIFFGNGGSAADAEHLAAEFVGRYLKARPPLPALALNANTSSLTAIGNDFGFDEVFTRQIEAMGCDGDIAVGLSTSGNSPNVIKAMEKARGMGLFTIALTGASGGRLRDVVDVLIAVPSEETPRIQECHILAGHSLCDVIDQTIDAGNCASSLRDADR